MDNRDPFIYKTTDFGRSWKRIDAKPAAPRARPTCARSPRTRTDAGCCSPAPATASTTRSTTARTGARSRTACRTRRLRWVVVQPDAHDVVVSTYGRGLYILDDITPLEQRARHPGGGAPELYAPRAGLPVQQGAAGASSSMRSPRAQGAARCSRSSTPAARTCARSSQGPRRIEPRGVGPALRLAARDRTAHDGAGQHAHLERAALSRRRLAPDHALGLEARRGRPDRRARHLHGEADRRRKHADTAADGAQGSAFARHRRRPCAVGRDAAADLRRHQQRRRHRQPDRVAAQAAGDRAGDARPGASCDKVSAVLAEEDDEPDNEPTPAPAKTLSRGRASAARSARGERARCAAKLQAVESKFVSNALQNSDDKYFVEPYGAYMNLIWLNAEVGTGGGDVAGCADFAPTAQPARAAGEFRGRRRGRERRVRDDPAGTNCRRSPASSRRRSTRRSRSRRGSSHLRLPPPLPRAARRSAELHAQSMRRAPADPPPG